MTYLLLTSSHGPQRSQSALSDASAARPGSSATLHSARSAQASIRHSAAGAARRQEHTTADSAASGAPAASQHSAEAPAPQLELGSVPGVPAAAEPAAAPAAAEAADSGAAAAAAAVMPPSSPELPSPVDGAWGPRLDAVPAELDYAALAADFAPTLAALAPPAAAPADAPAPAPVLLPAYRSAEAGAVLARLQLAPQQATEALLQLLEGGSTGAAPALTAEQASDLTDCLPSAEERAALAAYGGPAQQLCKGEQLMLEVRCAVAAVMLRPALAAGAGCRLVSAVPTDLSSPTPPLLPLQLARVPALEARLEAWRAAGELQERAAALEDAAAVLSGACQEVQRSEALPALLKISMLAGAGRCGRGCNEGALLGCSLGR